MMHFTPQGRSRVSRFVRAIMALALVAVTADPALTQGMTAPSSRVRSLRPLRLKAGRISPNFPAIFKVLRLVSSPNSSGRGGQTLSVAVVADGDLLLQEGLLRRLAQPVPPTLLIRDGDEAPQLLSGRVVHGLRSGLQACPLRYYAMDASSSRRGDRPGAGALP